jgi:hypothetical protein
MVEGWQGFFITAALWQSPLAEIRVPWWVWLLLVSIVLVVIFIALVLAQAPGPPLENPKQEDKTNDK